MQGIDVIQVLWSIFKYYEVYSGIMSFVQNKGTDWTEGEGKAQWERQVCLGCNGKYNFYFKLFQDQVQERLEEVSSCFFLPFFFWSSLYCIGVFQC